MGKKRPYVKYTVLKTAFRWSSEAVFERLCVFWILPEITTVL